jgi:hypothetical protein
MIVHKLAVRHRESPCLDACRSLGFLKKHPH